MDETEKRSAGGQSPGKGASLLPGFLALSSSNLVRTSAGFMFWVFVARLAPPAAVGVSGAVIATVALLSRFTSLGLGSFLMAELPKLPHAAARQVFRLSTTVLLTITVSAGLLWWGGVLLIGPDGGSSVSASVGSIGVALLFVATLVLTSISSVWDYGALGINRSSAQVTRNLIASFGRFPILLLWPTVVGDVDAVAVLTSWVAPIAVSTIVFAFQTDLASGMRSAPRRGRELLLLHWRTSLGHYFLDVSLAAGPLLVPVVAAAILAPTDNGFFTVAWMAASVVFVVPFALATSLFASSAAGGGAAFLRSSRRVLPAGLALGALGCVGTWVAGSLLFSVFGEDYVEESLPLTSVLVLAVLWMVVKDLMLDWYRLERRFTLATSVALAATLMDVVGALLGGLLIGGGMGVTVGWVAASGAQALVATPLILDYLRKVASAPAPPSDHPAEPLG
ncbi:lipopolysaccharide biosynthesis protein [Nocardioides sp.]|uniref:lipopolysaccharide biosynthesis protein n=1 Tax=Nocardioides sp. TaxID=35761 RepID=UPI003563A9AA